MYFNRLNREELERLRWSLDFENSACAHKIGKAKPLGFGSARIRIRGLNVREFHPDAGEWKLASWDLHDFGKNIAGNSDAVKTLKLMANAEKGCYPTDVGYPKLDGKKEGESFRWFAKNRQPEDRKDIQKSFTKILPKAVEEFGPQENQEKRLNTQAT